MTEHHRGIAALIGCSLAIFWIGSFIFGFPGVMAPLWKQSLEVSRGAIGNTLFFVLAAVGLLMFFVGRWQERVGIRNMLIIGGILCAADMLLLLWASSIYVIYLWAFLMGAASCFVYVPSLTAIQTWFPTRRGLVSGVFNLSFGISGAVMSPVFTLLIRELPYRDMVVLLSVSALVFGLGSAFLVSMPNPRETSDRRQGSPAAVDLGPSLTAREAAGTRSFWFLWVTWCLQGAAGIAMVPLAVQFGLHKGFTMTQAVLILTCFNLTNGVSRLLMGYLSDTIGRTRAMSFAFACAGAAYFLIPHAEQLVVILILAAAIGFAFGTLFSVSAPLVTDCFGIGHFGRVFGLVFTAYGFVAAPLGPSMSGYLLDATGANYTLVFGYLGCFCAISAVLIRFVRPAA